MRSTFSLGRIGGIQVGVNWTVLVIAALITFSLADFVLPQQVAGQSDATYLLAGIIGAVGLLGSILAHELGHAIVGRRNGLQIESITLWLFGGLAQLEGEIPNPRVEVKVAGVGPVISAMTGVAALAAALLIGTSNLAGAVLGWLGLVNIVLAVFNLLPGTPLDGGRLLHAFLWRRSGDRHRATRTASSAGRFIGYGLIGLGGLEFAMGGTVGGLWTATIGWILATAASAEGRHSEAQASLASLTLGEIAEPVDLVPDWFVVDEFVDRFVRPSRQSVFILQGFDGQVSGYVTVRELLKLADADRIIEPVRSFAHSLEGVPMLAADTSAIAVLAGRAAATSPLVAAVTEAGRIVAIVTSDQLPHALERARLVAKGRAKPSTLGHAEADRSA